MRRYDQRTWKQAIDCEIQEIVATMRCLDRYHSQDVLQDVPILADFKINVRVVQEHPLIQAFSDLQAALLPVHSIPILTDLRDIDPLVILKPFLSVVSAPNTTSTTTRAALESICNLITHRIIDTHHPDVHVAIGKLLYSVTRTKFEAAEHSVDETVFHSILHVLQCLVLSPLHRHITNEGILDGLEVCFGMYLQGRVSRVLRQYCADCLLTFTEIIWGRMHELVHGHGRGNMFSMPALLELLRVIGQLLDPHNHKHTDTLHRTIALKLLDRGFDVGGRVLQKWLAVEIKKRMASVEFENQVLKSAIDVDVGVSVVSVGADGPTYAKSAADLDAIDTNQKTSNPIADNEITRSPPNETMDSDNPNEEFQALESSDTRNPPKEFNDTMKLDTRNATINTNQDTNIKSGKDAKSPLENDALLYENKVTESIKERQFSATNSQSGSTTTNHEFHHNTHKLSDDAIPMLTSLIVDELPRLLIQLLRTQPTTVQHPPQPQNIQFIASILRALTKILCCGDIMVPQRDFILLELVNSLSKGVVGWNLDSKFETTEKTPKQAKPTDILVPRVRELYLGAIVSILATASPVQLFIYHDSRLHERNVLLETFQYLVVAGFPDIAGVTTTAGQAIALRGVVYTISVLVGGDATPASMVIEGTARDMSIEAISSEINRKREYNQGVKVFNESVKNGLIYFQKHGFLPDPLDEQALGLFFYNATGLSKKLLGEYIGKKENAETLKSFIDAFDFNGQQIDTALRKLLEKFRIPGESQIIDRILDCFSKRYFATCGEQHFIASEGAASVLSFSIIMLNTDQHNPGVKRRMTFEEYARNLRGLNEKSDFKQEFLQSIFNNIKKSPFVLAEEHEGEVGFLQDWMGVMSRMSVVPATTEQTGGNTHIYDSLILGMLWKEAVSLLLYHIQISDDQNCISLAALGLQNICISAKRFNQGEIIKTVFEGLIHTTSLLEDQGDFPEELDVLLEPRASDPTKPKALNRYISKFATNSRAHIALSITFNLLCELADNIASETWKLIFKLLGKLFLHQILPISMLTTEHFTRGKVTIPRLVPSKQSNADEKEIGFFGSFAQFLSISVVEDENQLLQEAVKISRAVIGKVGIEIFLAETRFVKDDTLIKLVDDLIQECYIQKELETNGSTMFSQASVYYLEILFAILTWNRDRLNVVWPKVRIFLMHIISVGVQSVLIERATTNMLKLLLRLSHKEDLQALIFESLERVALLSTETVHSLDLAAGLLVLAKTNMALLSKSGRWSIIFRILSVSATHPIAAQQSFELTSLIISGHPDSPITAEIFGDCVDLLISFSAGVQGSMVPSTSHLQQKKKFPTSGNDSVHDSLLPVASISLKFGIINNRGQTGQALERALQAVEKLYYMHLVVPKLMEQTNRPGWEFWLPILAGLGQQCCHPAIEIRHQALVYLQRLFLSDDLEVSIKDNIQERVDCFDIVLHPMLQELGKLSEEIGNGDTYMRATSMVSKVFLCFSPKLAGDSQFDRLWLEMLKLIAAMVENIREQSYLEGIQESIKNVVLVLISDQLLSQPQSDSPANKLWDQSWAIIDTFAPEMKNELEIISNPKQLSKSDTPSIESK